tara:strand:- start:16911 stop:17672 length:762 start_codon:yes stop_codon:yes gene_type:complete
MTPAPTPTPREILEFFVTYTAHKSTKAISRLAGTDAGNLHAALAGRRRLPGAVARRVAASVGLMASLDGDDAFRLYIDSTRHTVICLEVGVEQLPRLSGVVGALSSERLPDWRLVAIPLNQAGGEGVYAIALGSLPNCYIVINIVWPEASAVDLNAVQAMLVGQWPAGREAVTYFRDANLRWLRLRAGVEGREALDDLFMKPRPASIADWAELLISLDLQGVTPATVVRTLSASKAHDALGVHQPDAAGGMSE